MALPVPRPDFDGPTIYARTASIGASPVAGATVAVRKGRIQRAFAFSEGASTGTITVTVAVGGVSVGTIVFTGGSNAFGTSEFSPSGTVECLEGDVVTFTPAGGGGASIGGHFYAIIR